MFRALKSKGFKLESTHMTLHDHVERLLCLLTLTYVWCVLARHPRDLPEQTAWSPGVERRHAGSAGPRSSHQPGGASQGCASPPPD
ncbi:hypothetical protein [Deinococcus hopiensis]|uniref:hypothetical protein n=1 Tax=Deinococcus hopiensis TaxID=309885 RepID=UPI001FEBF04C|nr:hypothetical protein [Deinococcus hopiensis]